MRRKNYNKSRYNRIHYWLRQTYGRPTACSNKSCKGISKVISWALKKGKKYDFLRANFIPLCKSCHSSYDMTKAGIERTRKARLGKTISKEGRERIGLASRNKDFSYLKKEISLYKDNKLVKEFKSMTDCAKWLGCPISSISTAIDERYTGHHTVYGYTPTKI